MKNKIILLLLLIGCMLQNIDAQSVITKSYSNGKPYERVLLNGKDTFCIETFWENGLANSRRWLDSVHTYHHVAPQKVETRIVFQTPVPWAKRYFSDESEPNVSIYQRFDVQNRLWSNWVNIQNIITLDMCYQNGDTLIHYIMQRDENTNARSLISGLLIAPNYRTYSKSDYHTQTQKTWWYIGKHLCRLDEEKMPYDDDNPPISTTLYDSTGKITYFWSQDTLELRADKDNLKCLYGFRNSNNHWLIPPTYESVACPQEMSRYFIVNHQNKYGALDRYGKIMIPMEWDFLKALGEKKDDLAQRIKALEEPYPIPDSAHLRLACRRNNLFGAIDMWGNIVLKPDYKEVKDCKDDLYIIRHDSLYGVVDKTGRILVTPRYTDVQFTNRKDVFMTEVDKPLNDKYGTIKRFYGLVGANDQVILPTIFGGIIPEIIDNQYFGVKGVESDWSKCGLFHLTKGWIADTSSEWLVREGRYRVLCSASKQQGIYDLETQNWLLSADFDKIIHENNFYYQSKWLKNSHRKDVPKKDFTKDFKLSTSFFCGQGGKWGCYDAAHKNWIIPLKYDTLLPFGDRYIAAKNEKWFFLDANGQSLNRAYEGGGVFEDLSERSFQHRFMYDDLPICFMAEGDTMRFFHPNSIPFEADVSNAGWKLNPNSFLYSFKNQREEWLINANHRIVVSPKQKLLFEKSNYVGVQNKISGQVQIIDEQGFITKIASKDEVISVNLAQECIIVRDTATNKLGMVNLQQKRILPNQFFALTEVDSFNTFWGRSDFTPFETAKWHLARSEWRVHYGNVDSNWHIYNKNGKLLTQTVFDYPFEWSEGLGIGCVNDKMGLWNPQGVNVLPAQYHKIWHDSLQHLFYLFREIGVDNYQIGFANAAGQLVIDANLSNMSPFTGDCALVETANGYGVIQSNGQYLVPPAQQGLQKATFSIPERWRKTTQKYALKTDDEFTLPHSYWYLYFPHYDSKVHKMLDSLRDTAQKQAIENLLLEQTVKNYWMNGNNVPYLRHESIYFAPYLPQNPSTQTVFSQIKVAKDHSNQPFLRLQRDDLIRVDDVQLSGEVLQMKLLLGSCAPTNIPINFKKQYNIWNKLELETIISWNPANEKAIHQLLSNKIAQLKYLDLDCSESGQWLQKLKNKFHYSTNGLIFYLQNDRDSLYDHSVLLTWAELKPYLH